MTFITIVSSTFVWVIELHIYEKLIEFIIEFIASSRSGDHHEINNDLKFNDVTGDRRVYEMILSLLQLASLFLFFFLLQK